MSNNSTKFWDKTWTREDDRFYNHFQLIIDLLPEEGKILDIGCGTGTLLEYIKENKPKLKLEGQDHSEVAIKKLKKRGIKGMVVKLPVVYIGEKTDVIVATEVLEHIKEDERLLKVMSKGASKIIITVPNNRLGPKECNEHERIYTDVSLGKKLDKYFKHYNIYDAGLYLLAEAWN